MIWFVHLNTTTTTILLFCFWAKTGCVHGLQALGSGITLPHGSGVLRIQVCTYKTSSLAAGLALCPEKNCIQLLFNPKTHDFKSNIKLFMKHTLRFANKIMLVWKQVYINLSLKLFIYNVFLNRLLQLTMN